MIQRQQPDTADLGRRVKAHQDLAVAPIPFPPEAPALVQSFPAGVHDLDRLIGAAVEIEKAKARLDAVQAEIDKAFSRRDAFSGSLFSSQATSIFMTVNSWPSTS